jgi:hypothetical protein
MGHKNSTSIKGIAPLSGTILFSVIGDVDDFEDEGKLAAVLWDRAANFQFQRDGALGANPNGIAS